jgi:putrescine transport system permease protein
MTASAPWLRRVLIGLPFLWLGVFFLAPLLIVAGISLTESADAIPPFEPPIAFGPEGIENNLTTVNYRQLAEGCLRIYVRSIGYAASTTLLCLLIGFPMALAIARAPESWRTLLLFLVILPFWTSFLIRIYAWIAILKPAGVLNTALAAIGLPPVDILNSETAVLLGLVYAYLPFMVLPLYAVLDRQDESLIEAALDLGATPLAAFWRVTFPISLPGAAAGALLCFIPMAGEFVIPDLLGGSETLMLGRVIWTEFFANRDWPAASAVAIVLLATLTAPILLFEREQAKVLR